MEQYKPSHARSHALALTLALTIAASARAQNPVFQTPGMPRSGANGSDQVDRFSKQFNPAIGVVIDTFGLWADVDSGDDDGFDFRLRSLELTGQAWLDPRAWAYFVGVSSDEEDFGIEEAAINYVGFEGNSTLKAGRFFVDFGKQMQIHVHDLRTVERPLVLREYLGDELGGDGVEWDSWTPVGDGVLRWSVAVFGSLLVGEDEDDGPGALVIEAPDLKDVDEVNYTARLTGFADVGENGVLQLGTSVRSIPDFSFTADGSGEEADGLSNQVYGLDATYGWTGEEGNRSWTLGAEFLVNGGDNGAEIDDNGTPADPSDDRVIVLDDAVHGFYAYADHGWSAFDSAGVQWSRVELADGADSEVDEYDVYYTRFFSEFHRLRFAVTFADSDVDDDSLRFAIQYTGFIGAHAHGINW